MRTMRRSTARRRCWPAPPNAQWGISIDRSTLASWVGYAAAELKPLWRLMRDDLLASTRLFVDETKVPPLN